MNAAEMIEQLKNLPAPELAKVRDWFSEYDDESPALLAAVDSGLRSLREKGSRIVSREELEAKVRQWAGGSH